jgi:hypothetical protein
VSLFERLWKSVAGNEAAEKAELSGDLPRAVQLWMEQGAVDEAARVMLLRGDAEPDPRVRLQHYTQAAATATEGGTLALSARAKRAKLVIALADGSTLSTALRRDVVEAASILLASGDALAAAEGYRMAGDSEGEAHALAQAGEVERLESLLEGEQSRTKEARRAHTIHADIDALVGTGQRREALALAERSPDDPVARSRVARLRGSRATGPVVAATLRGQRLVLVLTPEVVIGRSEGAIQVASNALSRKHLRLTRSGDGFVAADMGSRNGTQLRGLNLAHPLQVGEVGEETTLTLGGEVPVVLARSVELPGALSIDIGGTRYTAPLREKGASWLGVAGWQLSIGSDDWIELTTEAPAYAGDLALASRITLLRGDSFAEVRGGDVTLRIDD